MQPRTERQKQIHDYILSFIERHGYEPSYAQIARHFGVKSKATIAKHITALERRGLISRQHDHGSFGLDVKAAEVNSDSVCEIAFRGLIAAGTPVESFAADSGNETVAVPRFLLGRARPENVFALRVRGDSMIDEHICDGDIALIEKRSDIRDGEIVVALIDGEESTLKRYHRSGSEVELRPANATMEPFRLAASRVAIQGVFRGLLRRFN